MIGDRVEPLAQRLGGVVEVEPDEATPGVARDLEQVALAAGRTLQEVVFVGNNGEFADRVEPPPVIGALEVAAGQGSGLGRDQAVPAVLTDVVERADPTVVAAHAQNRIAADLIRHVVAGFGNLIDPPRDLPDAWEQGVPLLPSELGRPVALARDRIVGQRRLGCFGTRNTRIQSGRKCVGHLGSPSTRTPSRYNIPLG